MAVRALGVVAVVMATPVVLGLVLAGRFRGSDGVVAVAVVWLIVLALLAGAAAMLVRLWRPVRRLIAAGGRLADGDYDVRVPEDGPVMTRPVLYSFNRMAARLQTADRQRRQLLADLGHELRTPLTVIRGDLEAMLDGVRPMDDDHLRLLLDDVEVLERLLDDLRTLSLAEAGALVLHREPTDLARVAADVVAGQRRAASAAGVRLVLDEAADATAVAVDPVRVHQVLSNLVGNALGATPAGGTVTVEVRRQPEHVVIEVRDTGVGIPADDVGRVFDRFHKGSGSSGTGLGLTISRDLVEAHGGTLTVPRTGPDGTTMRVALPMATPRTDDDPAGT